MTAQYWIAQHVEDLFRNEPRNIGIFVKLGDRILAKFVGETEDHQIDRSKTRGFQYPDVYTQWVEYWRTQILENNIEAVTNRNGAHYRVIPAGQITDALQDAPEDILNYLYAMLVSEGRFKEAIGVVSQLEERNSKKSVMPKIPTRSPTNSAPKDKQS